MFLTIKLFTHAELTICMKIDLALNNLQRLICHTNQPTSHHHHHDVVLPARISLTLSRHSSLSFIASGWFSGLHPVSSQRCCISVHAGRPAFARLYEGGGGGNWRTSLMSSSQLLQQCPACLVRLTLLVFVMGGRWPYSWCFMGVLPPGLVNLPSRFFYIHLVSVHVVHPYSSNEKTVAWKKLRFISSVKSDFHMTDSLSVAVYAFVCRVSMFFFLVDETLLPR